MTGGARVPWLGRLVDVRPHEVGAMLLGFVYFLLLLGSYYMLRPLRDALGIAGGMGALKWLFSATFVAMLIVAPLWSALVARVRRARLLPIVYRFFIVNLIVFFFLLRDGRWSVGGGRAFYVWLSVFNLLAVTVFWAFMADLFGREQGKRLFGFISAGGSLGAIAGPLVTSLVVTRIGTHNLLLLSALLLEGCAQCVGLLLRWQQRNAGADAPASSDEPIGGGAFSGIAVVVRSSYLLGIAAYTLCAMVSATFAYLVQLEIVRGTGTSAAAWTATLARLEVAANVATGLLQAFVVGRVLTRVGMTPALAALPPVYVGGFLALAASPTLAVSAATHVLRRSVGYGLVVPANHVLYTVVDREQKYKSKAFIETVVFRGGDVVGGWLYDALLTLRWGVGPRCLAAVPLGVAWAVLAVVLGRRYGRVAAAEPAAR